MEMLYILKGILTHIIIIEILYMMMKNILK